jgi:hypothetical protein
VLLPLDPAASESALGIADAAAALLRPPQGSAASSAPVIELGVASSRTGSKYITPDVTASLDAEEGREQLLASAQRDSLVSAATVALAESGIAARAPFLAKSSSLTASGGATPALLAVLQNPFHTGSAGRGGESGLPEQLLWWAPGDLMSLVTTTRAAIESARKAASASAGQATAADQSSTRKPKEQEESVVAAIDDASTVVIAESSAASTGLPASMAFSAVANVLTATLTPTPDAPHRIADDNFMLGAKSIAEGRARDAGVDPVTIDRAKRLKNPGGTFKEASTASVEGMAHGSDAQLAAAAGAAGAAGGGSSASITPEYDPVSGWRNGLFHGRLRLRHQALAHASASLRARAAAGANNGTAVTTSGGSDNQDALQAVLEARERDTSALPGRARLGERGSLGLWAVMVCDPISGPCRDAAAEWNVLADAIAGPIRADASFGSPAAPSATTSTTATATTEAKARPEGVTGIETLLAEAGAEVAYLRHWGVSLAAIDSTEPLAHPILRGLGVNAVPSLLALSCEASPEAARQLAVKLVNDTRDLQSLGMGMGSAMAVLRKAMPYKPELVGAGRANGRRDVTAAGAARWLASVVRSEAVSHVLEDDVHTITMSEDMKAAAKAFEDNLRRTAEKAVAGQTDPHSTA